MKKVTVLLILLLMLLSGCDPYTPVTRTPVGTESTTAPAATEEKAPTEPTAAPTGLPGTTGGHIHHYVAETVAPGCTEEGYTHHICACGDSFRDAPAEPLGHAWGFWLTTQPATVEQEGLQRRECGRCPAYETQTLPRLEPEHSHAYTATVVEATCTSAGYTNHVCSCGDSYRDSDTAGLGHSFAHYVSNADATCTRDGTKTAVCVRCTETDTVAEPGSALGHCWGQWVTTREPTVDAEGLRTRACDRCGASDTESVAKLPPVHVHDHKKQKVAATCTQGGYDLFTCECGDSYREETSQPKGHSWGEWAVDTAPTVTQAGRMVRGCTACDAGEYMATECLPSEHGFVFVLLPGTVGRNEKATVAIIGQAGVTYDIDVFYKSGESSAKGLEDKAANEKGYVCWTWKIGPSTAAGTYRIEVTGAGETQTVYFTVEV